MEWLLNVLELNKLPLAKEASVQKAQQTLHTKMQVFFKTLRNSPFFDKVELESVKNFIDINNKNNLLNTFETEDIDVAFMRRLLEIERSDYWSQFEDGNIGRQATFILSRSVEEALDNTPIITPRPSLEDVFKLSDPPKWIDNVPFMGEQMDNWVFTHLSLSYDIARGFITAQEKIRLHVKKLQPSQQAGDLIEDMINKNCSMTLSYIQHVNETYPELISQLQLKSVRRLLLNHERSLIWKMEHDGVLENAEAQHLIDDIELQMHKNKV